MKISNYRVRIWHNGNFTEFNNVNQVLKNATDFVAGSEIFLNRRARFINTYKEIPFNKFQGITSIFLSYLTPHKKHTYVEEQKYFLHTEDFIDYAKNNLI